MKSRDFVYWLQGFAELYREPPTPEQWLVIKNHLNLVFKHEIDPSMPDPTGALQAAHDGKPPLHPQFGGTDGLGNTLRC